MAATSELAQWWVGRSATKGHCDALYKNGWMGGGMWLWTVIGVLVVVLLAVVIGKQSKK